MNSIGRRLESNKKKTVKIYDDHGITIATVDIRNIIYNEDICLKSFGHWSIYLIRQTIGFRIITKFLQYRPKCPNHSKAAEQAIQFLQFQEKSHSTYRKTVVRQIFAIPAKLHLQYTLFNSDTYNWHI